MRVPAPLRLREFRLLFLGQGVSLLGDGMLGVALSFAVLGLSSAGAIAMAQRRQGTDGRVQRSITIDDG